MSNNDEITALREQVERLAVLVDAVFGEIEELMAKQASNHREVLNKLEEILEEVRHDEM